MVKALLQLKHTLTGAPVPDEAALVAIAQDIEATCLLTPTGIQDYWGAVNGGVSVISYPPGGPTIKKYGVDLLPQLAEELIVCYSGKSRNSGINNWQIFKGVMEGDASLISLLDEIGFHSGEMAQALIKGEWQELLRHSAAEWQLRCKLSEGIETAETRRIHRAALGAGAYFTRICGAGGGGVMAIFAPQEKKSRVIAATQEAGGSILAAALTDQGAKIDAHPLS
jgi:D-glycero-alpha-D-manno-heptose-7-phosphate kinase